MTDFSQGYGAPLPPAGAPGQLASWGERAIAAIINWAIIVVGYVVVLIVALILGAVSSALGTLVGLVGYLALVAASFYFYYLDGSTGQSPGKRLTGLRVISETTGQLIGGGMGIGRGLAHIVDSIICYIGWLFPLWDAKKQTLADKIVKTVVVTGAPKQPLGINLFK
ncbi:hypothetical protein BH10ACT8_BH10ACT8_19170 [soil metagenome]|jgi:uncharacterized RDD family membrane protein YckC